MEHPFTFGDPSRPRFVTNVKDNNFRVGAGTATIWGASVYLYARRVLRVNGNAVNFAAFTALSVPAAYGYAKTIFDSAENEAAVINNERE